MPDNVRFNITKVLRANEKNLQDKLVAIGGMVEGSARLLIEPRVDTGRARDSIIWATKDRKSTVGGKAHSDDGIDQPSESLTVWIGSSVDYFPYIEFGTKYMKRQAPLRKAIASKRQDIKKVLSL